MFSGATTFRLPDISPTDISSTLQEKPTFLIPWFNRGRRDVIPRNQLVKCQVYGMSLHLASANFAENSLKIKSFMRGGKFGKLILTNIVQY